MTERIEYNGKIWDIPIVYTDNIIYDWAAGVFTGSEIKIRPMYKGRLGILEHEKEHALQFMMNRNHMLDYLTDPEYRYYCEIEAYKKTIKYSGYTDVSQIMWIVRAISENYEIDKNDEYTIDRLKVALNKRNKLKRANLKPLYAVIALMALIVIIVAI